MDILVNQSTQPVAVINKTYWISWTSAWIVDIPNYDVYIPIREIDEN